MESEKVDAISSVDEANNWLPFVIGAAAQACFVEMPLDPGRERRNKWAGRALFLLRPVIGALLQVARNHPDEFKLALGKPVEITRMPE